VDVRVACATHRDLGRLQREGRFRGDLYARLNEYSLTLPPLRERKEDALALCRALLSRHGRPDLSLSFPFMAGLLHYDFPFNVRELEAIIKRGVALADGPTLEAEHLSDDIKELMKSYGRRRGAAAPASPADPSLAGSQALLAPGPTHASAAPRAPGRAAVPTEEELRALLLQHRGNVAAVGRELGKERMQIHRWMKRYNINVDEYR